MCNIILIGFEYDVFVSNVSYNDQTNLKKKNLSLKLTYLKKMNLRKTILSFLVISYRHLIRKVITKLLI